MKLNPKPITEEQLIELFSFYSQMDEFTQANSDFLDFINNYEDDMLDEDDLAYVAGGIHPIYDSNKD